MPRAGYHIPPQASGSLTIGVGSKPPFGITGTAGLASIQYHNSPQMANSPLRLSPVFPPLIHHPRDRIDRYTHGLHTFPNSPSAIATERETIKEGIDRLTGDYVSKAILSSAPSLSLIE